MRRTNADGREGFVAREREPADFPRVGVLYASGEGFLKLPVIGGLLVPSVPSSNGGAATEFAKADRA